MMTSQHAYAIIVPADIASCGTNARIFDHPFEHPLQLGDSMISHDALLCEGYNMLESAAATERCIRRSAVLCAMVRVPLMIGRCSRTNTHLCQQRKSELGLANSYILLRMCGCGAPDLANGNSVRYVPARESV
jgi:hypothetical protein